MKKNLLRIFCAMFFALFCVMLTSERLMAQEKIKVNTDKSIFATSCLILALCIYASKDEAVTTIPTILPFPFTNLGKIGSISVNLKTACFKANILAFH